MNAKEPNKPPKIRFKVVIIENKAMKNGYIDALIHVNEEGMPLKKLVQFAVIELREN